MALGGCEVSRYAKAETEHCIVGNRHLVILLHNAPESPLPAVAQESIDERIVP